MIIYIGNLPIKIEWALLNILSEEMERNWITWLMPLFEDRQKAIDFCGKDWYLLLSRKD